MDAAEQWEDKGTMVFDISALFYRALERWKMFVCLILTGALIAGLLCFFVIKPEYQSVCKMYIKNQSNSVVNLSELQVGAYLASDYQELIYTWEVQDKVITNLGLNYSYSQLAGMITLTNPSNTRLLYITARSNDPYEAQSIANEFANVSAEYISEMMSMDKPSIVSAAQLPKNPASPNTTLGIALGIVCGFLLGLIIVVIQFLSDDKIKTASDLTALNLDALAVIPINDLAHDEYLRSKSRV